MQGLYFDLNVLNVMRPAGRTPSTDETLWLVLMPAFWREVPAVCAVRSLRCTESIKALSQKRWGVTSEKGRQALIEK